MDRTFLTRVQLFDAATCLAAGALCAVGAAPVATLTGLPPELLRGAGVFLLGFGAVVLWSARAPSRPLITSLTAANAAWVLASLALLLFAGLPLTTLGVAFVAVQALAVAGIVALQLFGLIGRPGTLRHAESANAGMRAP